MQVVLKLVRILTVQKQLHLLSPGMVVLLFSSFPVTTGRTAHWDCAKNTQPVGLLSAGHYCCQAISWLPFINILFSYKQILYMQRNVDVFSCQSAYLAKGFFGFFFLVTSRDVSAFQLREFVCMNG